MFDVVVDLGAVWLGSSSSTSSSFSDTFVSYLETTEDKESGGPVVRFGWKDVAPFVGTFVYYVYSVPATKCRALVYGRISNSCKSVSYLIWKIGVVTFKSFNMPSWLNPPPPPRTALAKEDWTVFSLLEVNLYFPYRLAFAPKLAGSFC